MLTGSHPCQEGFQSSRRCLKRYKYKLVPWYRGMQDGGDAFQGASAAAVLEAIALVLALTFPDTAAVPDFRAQGSVGKVGTGA